MEKRGEKIKVDRIRGANRFEQTVKKKGAPLLICKQEKDRLFLASVLGTAAAGDFHELIFEPFSGRCHLVLFLRLFSIGRPV